MAAGLAVATLGFVRPASGQTQGDIIVASDDWTLSDAGFVQPRADPGEFALNIAAWFTDGAAGSFLAYTDDFGLSGDALAATMTDAGHSWTVTTAVPFELDTLLLYDAVFLGGPPLADARTLVAFVNAGGNVFVHGGTGIEDGWNAFLGEFGMSFGGGFDPFGALVVPIVSAHPLFDGVDGLYQSQGSPVLDLIAGDDANVVLVSHDGFPIYGLYLGQCVAPADVSGDGVIDVTDLVLVILAWDTANTDADVNADGVVDVQDLIAVITAWGPSTLR